ncbi:methyl-accepting chemotaxis protein [Desulfogranum japonicum]|uniref:methyl-accepting chemotaxis protein n=1 Tax=Desulfogranum japonicum TaxID=231447 RepID=UPI00040A524A|nr:methyl-accepting chemotaxis protein [Desulfogranum japonicum]
MLETWLRKLAPVESILHDLQSTTENEFMEIGEKLGEMSSFSDHIFQQLTAIVDAFTAEENLSTHRLLVDKLKGIEEYIQDNLDTILEEKKQLEEQKQIFHGLQVPLTKLNVIIFRLNTLGLYIKAETTRLTKADNEFEYLGNEVRKLTDDSKEKLESMQTAREDIIQAIIKANTEMSTLREKEFIPLSAQIEQLLAEMVSYTQLVDMVGQESEQVAGQFQMIRDNIGELIFELQFHDIVRQQIEHVQAILSEVHLPQPITSEPAPETYEDTESTTLYASTLLAADLLENAHKTVMKALSSIFSQFQNVLDQTTSVGDDLAKLVQVSLHQIDTMIRHAIHEKQKIEITLIDTMKVHGSRTNTMRSIVTTSNTIKQQIDAISSIGEDVGLISLNGLIQAHHLQKEGQVIGVVIDEIRNLVGDTQENIHALEAYLKDIDRFDTEQHLSAETSEEYKTTENIIHETITLLGNFFDDIKNRTSTAYTTGGTVQQSSREHVEQLTATLRGITVQEQFDQGLQTAITMLRSLLVEIDTSDTPPDLERVQELLHQYKDQYTMASERLTHHKVTGKEETYFEHDEELDDNIEMF